jgi:hypothetical protein
MAGMYLIYYLTRLYFIASTIVGLVAFSNSYEDGLLTAMRASEANVAGLMVLQFWLLGPILIGVGLLVLVVGEIFRLRLEKS